jgi:hypothetical protein
VPGVRGRDGAARQQQPQRGRFQFAGGLLDGLVVERVLVGSKQQCGALRADRIGQSTGQQVGNETGTLLVLLAPPGHGRQRSAQNVGRGRAETALALAMKIDRCRMQPQQDGRRLDRGRLVPEVFAGQLFEAEFLLRRALPQKIQLDRVRLATGLLKQLRAGRALETQQHVAGLDLDTPPAGQLDLKRRLRRRQHGAHFQITFVLE